MYAIFTHFGWASPQTVFEMYIPTFFQLTEGMREEAAMQKKQAKKMKHRRR